MDLLLISIILSLNINSLESTTTTRAVTNYSNKSGKALWFSNDSNATEISSFVDRLSFHQVKSGLITSVKPVVKGPNITHEPAISQSNTKISLEVPNVETAESVIHSHEWGKKRQDAKTSSEQRSETSAKLKTKLREIPRPVKNFITFPKSKINTTKAATTTIESASLKETISGNKNNVILPMELNISSSIMSTTNKQGLQSRQNINSSSDDRQNDTQITDEKPISPQISNSRKISTAHSKMKNNITNEETKKTTPKTVSTTPNIVHSKESSSVEYSGESYGNYDDSFENEDFPIPGESSYHYPSASEWALGEYRPNPASLPSHYPRPLHVVRSMLFRSLFTDNEAQNDHNSTDDIITVYNKAAATTSESPLERMKALVRSGGLFKFQPKAQSTPAESIILTSKMVSPSEIESITTTTMLPPLPRHAPASDEKVEEILIKSAKQDFMKLPKSRTGQQAFATYSQTVNGITKVPIAEISHPLLVSASETFKTILPFNTTEQSTKRKTTEPTVKESKPIILRKSGSSGNSTYKKSRKRPNINQRGMGRQARFYFDEHFFDDVFPQSSRHSKRYKGYHDDDDDDDDGDHHHHQDHHDRGHKGRSKNKHNKQYEKYAEKNVEQYAEKDAEKHAEQHALGVKSSENSKDDDHSDTSSEEHHGYHAAPHQPYSRYRNSERSRYRTPYYHPIYSPYSSPSRSPRRYRHHERPRQKDYSYEDRESVHSPSTQRPASHPPRRIKITRAPTYKSSTRLPFSPPTEPSYLSTQLTTATVYRPTHPEPAVPMQEPPQQWSDQVYQSTPSVPVHVHQPTQQSVPYVFQPTQRAPVHQSTHQNVPYDFQPTQRAPVHQSTHQNVPYDFQSTQRAPVHQPTHQNVPYEFQPTQRAPVHQPTQQAIPYSFQPTQQGPIPQPTQQPYLYQSTQRVLQPTQPPFQVFQSTHGPNAVSQVPPMSWTPNNVPAVTSGAVTEIITNSQKYLQHPIAYLQQNQQPQTIPPTQGNFHHSQQQQLPVTTYAPMVLSTHTSVNPHYPASTQVPFGGHNIPLTTPAPVRVHIPQTTQRTYMETSGASAEPQSTSDSTASNSEESVELTTRSTYRSSTEKHQTLKKPDDSRHDEDDDSEEYDSRETRSKQQQPSKPHHDNEEDSRDEEDSDEEESDEEPPPQKSSQSSKSSPHYHQNRNSKSSHPSQHDNDDDNDDADDFETQITRAPTKDPFKNGKKKVTIYQDYDYAPQQGGSPKKGRPIYKNEPDNEVVYGKNNHASLPDTITRKPVQKVIRQRPSKYDYYDEPPKENRPRPHHWKYAQKPRHYHHHNVHDVDSIPLQGGLYLMQVRPLASGDQKAVSAIPLYTSKQEHSQHPVQTLRIVPISSKNGTLVPLTSEKTNSVVFPHGVLDTLPFVASSGQSGRQAVQLLLDNEPLRKHNINDGSYVIGIVQNNHQEPRNEMYSPTTITSETSNSLSFGDFKKESSTKTPRKQYTFIEAVPPIASDTKISTCDFVKCQLPNCFCGSNSVIPGNLKVEEVPQMIMLTFDDSVNDINFAFYQKLLGNHRVNPNGCPIKATFYISHEWTDYGRVQKLYEQGHEIASHSISHRDGVSFSQQRWKDEIIGEKEILTTFGRVPLQDIRGMRAPFLQLGGDNQFTMLIDSNMTYDSSIPARTSDPPFWPYTLDYGLPHECNIPPCPKHSYPGLWEVPMIMWTDLQGGHCSMADACSNPQDAEGVYEMLMANFERHYLSNRAPFGMFYHYAWFTVPHHLEGFTKFLNAVQNMKDVFFTTTSQMLEWMRKPTPISELVTFKPWKCNNARRISLARNGKACLTSRACSFKFNGTDRVLRTCHTCPQAYPWTGNPKGLKVLSNY